MAIVDGVSAETLQIYWLNTAQQLIIGPHQFCGQDAADVADYMTQRFVDRFPIINDPDDHLG
jgi:hypothetical protein